MITVLGFDSNSAYQTFMYILIHENALRDVALSISFYFIITICL